MDLKKLAGVTAYYKKEDGTEMSSDEYYSLVIEKLGGLEKVIGCIPFTREVLAKAFEEDPNFNNLPLVSWDRAAGFVTRNGRCDMVGSHLTYLYREHGVTCYCCSEGVSLLKEAAKEWIGIYRTADEEQ